MKNNTEYSYFLWWHKKIKAINLLGGKCQECGEDRPWLLNFHHKNPEEKEFHIKDIRRKRWSFLIKEIKKCKLLCYNCHKEKHHNKKTVNVTRKNKLLEIKKIFSCEICGYNTYIGALDFHHERDKKFLLNSNLTKIDNDIIKEINKCKVFCANCHQDLHFDKKKFEEIKKEYINYNYKENSHPIDIDKVYNLFVIQKFKQIDIAKQLQCTPATISYIIKRNNWRKNV